MFREWIIYLSAMIRLWCSKAWSILKTLLFFSGLHNSKDMASINEALETAGYAYDPDKDIFYSILYPWQRKYGYCRAYDEAAAPMGMIIDCEPVYFEYAGKNWLIEFWKGQYDLATGCEVGIYTSSRPVLNIPGIFFGTLYDSADKNDFLPMSYSLRKNDRTLFTREELHWWLTGFKLGEFSEPSELKMFVNISLKDTSMRDAFLQGLRMAGYNDREIDADGNTVSFLFLNPRTNQPHSRTKATDEIIQKKNKLLCDRFIEVTRGCTTLQEKLTAVSKKSPDLLGHVLSMGRPLKLYDQYKKFRGSNDR